MVTKIVTAKRVSYGKTSTPVSDREYKLSIGGPVGTKKEWRVWAKENKVKIKFIEKTPKSNLFKR